MRGRIRSGNQRSVAQGRKQEKEGVEANVMGCSGEVNREAGVKKTNREE